MANFELFSVSRLKDQDNFLLWKVVADKIFRPVGRAEAFHVSLSF